MDRIRRYRENDRSFSKVFAAIAEEEALHGREDPTRGVVSLERRGKRVGSAVTAVRQLIGKRR